MQVTQPSGSLPSTPCTIAKVASEDDTAELPPFSVERGTVLAECDRLQLGELIAAAGAAREDRRLVVDQLAAAGGESGRPFDQACPLLLAAFGGESCDAAPLWGHAVQDRSATLASGVGEPQTQRISR
jgi:hypothetical protein